jgi:hypothetical protein
MSDRMSPTVITLLAGAVLALGCAARDEVIAIAPADGGDGGTGGSAAGGAPPVVTFAAPTEHPLACGQADDILSADVDGDENIDVLVAGDCLNVFSGDGDGGLQPRAAWPNGFGSAVAVGYVDTNHPEQPTDPIDVVGFADPLHVYLGDGLGGFVDAGSLDAGGPGRAGSVGLSQLYGSGAVELVTVSGTVVSLWTGDGTGGFLGPHPVDLGATVDAFTYGDFDGDGRTDLLVARGGLVLLRNRDDGSLEEPEHIAAADGASTVIATEVDGDGCLDAVAIDGHGDQPAPVDGQLHVLRNVCDGTFTVAHASTMADAVAVAAADLDGDGTSDLLVARAGLQPALITMVGAGDGTFDATREHPLGAAPGRLAVGDFNLDGRTDIVVTAHASGAIALLLNTTF